MKLSKLNEIMINYLMIWKETKGENFWGWGLVRVNEFKKLKLCVFINEVV